MAVTGYLGYTNTPFARQAHTTLAKHIRDVEQAMLRKYVLGALLESRGRILYNQGGEGFDWPVEYKLHRVAGNTGETQRNWERVNLWQKAYLEYRGYQATDQIFKKGFLANRGEQAIVNIFDGLTDRLERSLKQGLGPEYYRDGNAAGAETSWHGLDTMFQNTGTIDTTATTAATRAKNAADIHAWPTGTYAGLTTTLGNYGGANETGVLWPYGVADSHYDFYTPLLIVSDTTHADIPASTDTWSGQGDELIRYALTHAGRNQLSEGEMSNFVLDRVLFFQFKNLIDDKERIMVSSELELRSLGFKNSIEFDGAEITAEHACTANAAYGFTPESVEMRCMDASMFDVEGPEYDIDSQSYKAVVSTLSNLKFTSPRGFAKIAPLADWT